MEVKKAVIPVAGLGTRFLPATKSVPKELLPIVDMPSIQLVVQEAVDAGIEEIIFVTGRGKDAIEDHFDEAPELEQILTERGNTEMVKTLRRIAEMIEVVSVRQKRPLGLGHAVLCARDLVGNEPFAVMLADDLVDSEVPCVRQLVDIFNREEESVDRFDAGFARRSAPVRDNKGKGKRAANLSDRRNGRETCSPSRRRPEWRSSGDMCYGRKYLAYLQNNRLDGAVKSS